MTTAKPKYIYAPSGRAQEYCKLALNHYTGCAHGCTYCYAPSVLHRKPEDFHGNVKVRLSIDAIQEDAQRAKAAGLSGDILLSFTTDPYQPLDKETGLTRQTIIALQKAGFSVVVLTKAGELARRDFDLLRPGIDTFATSLTCSLRKKSVEWEPNAGYPLERLYNLYEAHRKGIKTWVSCEPVIDPADTRWLIRAAEEHADHFKIGTMNYDLHGKSIDWKAFAESIVELQPKVNRPFYIKADLAAYLGKGEGFWLGGEVS